MKTKISNAAAKFLKRVGDYGNAHTNEWMPVTVADLKRIFRHDLQGFLDVRGELEDRTPMPEIVDATHHLAVRWTPAWREHMEAARDSPMGATG